MGLSKLSEKCQKCNRKNTCDNKRMEACAYIVPKLDGAFPIDSNGLFIEHEGQPELIGRIGDKPFVNQLEPTLESIRKAVEKGIMRTIKGSVM